MAHWKTISEHEHRSERLNRLCKMKKFTDNFLRSRQGKSLDYVLAYLVDITVEKCNEKVVKSICKISHTAPSAFYLKHLRGHLNDELGLRIIICWCGDKCDCKATFEVRSDSYRSFI